MLFVLIALWAVAAIVWLSDRRASVNRWLGAVAFSGGAGALAAVLDLQWLPVMEEAGMNEVAQQLLYRLQASASLISYYGLPYAFLLFAMAYQPVRLPDRLQELMPFLLLLPIIGCIVFTPFYTEMYPISFKIVVWWAVPYMLYGAVQVLLKRQLYAAFSRTHWIVCSAVLPPVLFCMVMNYVLPSFGMLRMWVYNTWIVGLGVTVFVVGLFTYGFMGVRVMVDRRRFDSTLRAVTSGTAILNHAIKNDAGKMRLFSEKMKAYAIATDQQELLADIETVLNASRHMQDMLQRVHRRTEDLVLQAEEVDLALLIDQTLKSYAPALGGIKLRTELLAGWTCRVDPAQVSEALGNIAANALEAMKGNGELLVRFSETKRVLIIEVRDTGPGMEKSEIKKVLEPFYTTKSGSDTNFGLGLPYAYHVMRKHKGMLQLRSKIGEGTSVIMTFPKRSVQAEKRAAPSTEGGEGHGQHSGMDYRG
ncbi:HAMP domain-containing histidine kinase [Paenibacillus alkaliterrae]|uniref:sensor histidine kinase n=1 Tax=Paenibacillus alkaliterrae TaxID=320909 RepID=UPI001F3EE851|nr:HAMP domain-containing sensor histidine kinase [Paenibacillus alkaliterrae]MCF2939351.1 HAMP domain-containing histidine kinase [Paenibacillus alkaliterrae]